jgi:acyl-CoA thioester hydrolase
VARFVHEVHMRWSDMDAYRHINNTAYLSYLESARVAMFFSRFEGFSAGTVIARHEIDYLHPVVFHPEPLRLELWVDTVRAASFVVHYEVIDTAAPAAAGGSRVAARASTTCVTVDLDANRPRRLTPEEREILAGYADERPAGTVT